MSVRRAPGASRWRRRLAFSLPCAKLWVAEARRGGARRAPAASALAFASVVLFAAPRVQAWGSSGHRFIARGALAALPDGLPAFLRSPTVAAQIGELAREPDRWRGAGAPHDPDLDSGHFIDLDDTGHVSDGRPADGQGPTLDALPRSHAEFDAVTTRAGLDPAKTGWLPYNIEEGYQGLVKDFAYWRILTTIIPKTSDPATKAAYVADLALRQSLIVRDLGVWSHYVGDASQPMHVSIHYNGWGDYPNPRAYTQDHIHGPFEGEYVRANLSAKAVEGAMPPATDCEATIQVCTVAYLTATAARTEPLYALWTAGGFAPGDPRGRGFVLERVAAGAGALRDLVVKAWRASGEASIGRPAIYVRDVERGRTPIRLEDLYGDD